jgi:thiamine kinase-like enzyme
MSDSLDLEVAVALDRAGFRAKAFRRISTVHAPHAKRSVFRIELESGRTIKARRVEDEKTARRLFEARRELPDAFASVFASYGAVLFEDWIHGEEVGSTPPSDAHLIEAGSLLACLHATPSVAGHPAHEMRSTAAWRRETEGNLREILAASGLDEQQALLIHTALERRDPQRAVFGLVHTDFCGENMVIDWVGRLRIVDNEWVGIDALGYDLARTWYRWALPYRAWERFRSAYADRKPLAEPLETLGFWSIVALVQSAALRLRQDRVRAQVPLDRLRRMAVELGR